MIQWRKGAGTPFLHSGLKPLTTRDLLEDLDANSDHSDSAQNRDNDRENRADGIHDVGSHAGETGGKSGSDGIGSSLTSFLLSKMCYAPRMIRITSDTIALTA